MDTDEFAEHRPLGAEAEDAYLRWSSAERATIAAPAEWLAKVVTNLCLNRLTSARARRESYVGAWLPEPVLTDGAALGPLDAAGQQVSLGLLETLTPTERAAFGYRHRDIAVIVDLSEVNCRQLHSRARRPVDRAGWRTLVDRFLRAAAEGDLPALEELPPEDVTSWADDGRRATVAKYLVRTFDTGLARFGVTASFGEFNGAPAILGWVGEAFVLDVVDGRIATPHILANPDKLGHAAQLSHPGGVLT